MDDVENRSSGISPSLKAYVQRAIGEVKLALYANHLPPEVIGQMRRHQQSRAREWPALIDRVKAQMQADPSPAAPLAKGLAGQWFDLFQDMVGDDRATVAHFRRAVESEPALQMGRGMTDEMIVFLRRAMQPACLTPSSRVARTLRFDSFHLQRTGAPTPWFVA